MAKDISQKDLTTLLESIRTENYTGKFVDDEFCKRNFGHLVFDGQGHVDDILQDLTKQGILLHFIFGDRQWYVHNDRYTVEEVLRKQVEDEVSHAAELIAQTRDETERRRLLLKQSVIRQIQQSLEQRFVELARMDDARAAQILGADTRLRDQLIDLVSDHTKKFKASLNQKDLATSEVLKRLRATFGDHSLSQLMETLEALEHQGRVLIVPLPDRQRFFLDVMQLDAGFLQILDRERNTSRATAEGKAAGKDDKGTKHLAEYNRFMMIDNIMKLAEKRQQADHAEAFQKAQAAREGEKAQGPAAATAVEADRAGVEKDPKEAAPAAAGAKPAAASPYLMEEDPDALKAVFTDRLPDEELDQELSRLLDYEQSRQLMLGYLKAFREAPDETSRRIHFSTFFSCVSLRIRIPEETSSRLYELAREYLNRMGGRMPPELREDAENHLIEADRKLKQSVDEEKEFRRFPLARP
ncbi:MAG: hypothetical protein J0L75_07875 [Spirochaetes bacterium]|nr:hypothetical protein [Spirochaetota bacterium]